MTESPIWTILDNTLRIPPSEESHMPNRTIRFSAFFILSIITGCTSQQSRAPSTESIAKELLTMRASDQRLEHLVVNQDPQISEPGFFKRKDQAQAQNAKRCKEIFNQIGYPTNTLVGTDASQAFWLLVQHADADPAFQQQVAIAMKQAVIQGEAPAENLAMLTDRVHINTNRPQIYGSQVLYNMKTARAYPKPIQDPQSVDQRRTEVGLPPLWQYMNEMSELNHMVNQQQHKIHGPAKPWTYPADFTDW